jgi:hypothetical protein
MPRAGSDLPDLALEVDRETRHVPRDLVESDPRTAEDGSELTRAVIAPTNDVTVPALATRNGASMALSRGKAPEPGDDAHTAITLTADAARHAVPRVDDVGVRALSVTRAVAGL